MRCAGRDASQLQQDRRWRSGSCNTDRCRCLPLRRFGHRVRHPRRHWLHTRGFPGRACRRLGGSPRRRIGSLPSRCLDTSCIREAPLLERLGRHGPFREDPGLRRAAESGLGCHESKGKRVLGCRRGPVARGAENCVSAAEATALTSPSTQRRARPSHSISKGARTCGMGPSSFRKEACTDYRIQHMVLWSVVGRQQHDELHLAMLGRPQRSPGQLWWEIVQFGLKFRNSPVSVSLC